MSVVLVDLDGTLLENSWPKLGDWLPGSRESMLTLLEAGHSVYIYSARLSGYWPNGKERDPGSVFIEQQAVRDLLDKAGLMAVGITKEPKPFWDVLIDDKVIWFPGGPRSWKMVMPRVLSRLKDEDTFKLVMDHFEDEEGG